MHIAGSRRASPLEDSEYKLVRLSVWTTVPMEHARDPTRAVGQRSRSEPSIRFASSWPRGRRRCRVQGDQLFPWSPVRISVSSAVRSM